MGQATGDRNEQTEPSSEPFEAFYLREYPPYLRQQTREQDPTVRYEDDSIKLADDHAEVWQAVRTLPPLQAQVIALHYYEDYSVAQVDAASRLREIARHSDRLVAHGRATSLPDEPKEPSAPLPPWPRRWCHRQPGLP